MSFFWRNVFWDLRSIYRSGALVGSIVILLAFCIMALYQGLMVTNQWQQQVVSAQASVEENIAALQKEPPETPKAVAVTFFMQRPPVILPPAPLVELATGRTDLEPRVGKAGAFKQSNTMFRDYQIEGPIQVALGKLDLVFVVQWLFPLIIIGLGFGLLTEDRGRGVDRLLRIQGASLCHLTIARLVARSAVTLVPIILVLIFVWGFGQNAGMHIAQKSNRLMWAAFLIFAYIGFWWALVLWVNTWRLGRSQNLAVLVLVWIINALVLPALVSVASRSAHPAPSRHALVAESRAQEIAATKLSAELMGGYVHDHPELDKEHANKLPWWVGIHLISKEVDSSVATQSNDFVVALESQQTAARKWRFLSPALMLYQGMTGLAGTDEKRFAEFRKQAQLFQNEYREAAGKLMIVDQKLDIETFKQLSSFKFKEPRLEETRSQIMLSISFLNLLILLLAVHAMYRLKSTQPD